MRRLLWPLGLAAWFCNPSWAQAPDLEPMPAPSTPLRAGPMYAAAPAALTLDAALAIAQQENPALAAAERELEATRAALIQAHALPNPVIAADVQDQRARTRTSRLLIHQPIELGGKHAARVAAADQGRAAADTALRAGTADVRAIVRSAFVDALIAQEYARLAASNAELAARAREATDRLVRAGKVSPVDLTRAEVGEATARIALSAAARDQAAARQRLAAALGRSDLAGLHPAGDARSLPALASPAELRRRLETAPRWHQAQVELDRRAALLQVERRRRIPDVTVSLGAQRDNELDLDQTVFGVSVPIPLFDRNRGNLEEAVHRVDKARDEQRAAQLDLVAGLDEAIGRDVAARRQLDLLARDILPGAQSAYDAALRGFELGKFGFLEVLDAQRTLSAAKSQELDALREAHHAAASIERLLGDAATQP